MRGEQVRVYCQGPWGDFLPPFAYDLFSGEMWKRAKSRGLIRMGKPPGDGEDDKRPICLAYIINWANPSWSPRNGSLPLVRLGNAIQGEENVWGQTDAKPNQAGTWRCDTPVGRNQGFSFRAYLYEPPKAQILKLWQLLWGGPGRGYVFQIRNGTPEIGSMSQDFNLGDLGALKVLWGIPNPNVTQQGQIDDLVAKIFDNFESLSFERSTGKSDWYRSLWTLSFIPEARGMLHIVLEGGGDATAHENKKIIDTRLPGVLWDDSALDMFCAGGMFFFQRGYPTHVSEGRMLFGGDSGFQTGYFTEALGDLSKEVQAYKIAGQDVTLEFIDHTDAFNLLARVTTSNVLNTPWIYGISARLAPGTRALGDETTFDTDKPYVPIAEGAIKLDKMPVLDIVPNWDGETNRRTVAVTIWDPMGLSTTASQSPIDQYTTVEIGNELLIRGMTRSPLKRPNVSQLTAGLPNIFTSLGDTGVEFTVADGWEMLSQTYADPAPVGDNHTLGYNLRAYLAQAGFVPGEMVGVSPEDGKLIIGAALGEKWACTSDGETTCADAIRALLESYGYGWRFYQGRDGNWYFKRIDRTSKGNFTSSKLPHDVHTEPGRLKICRKIDLISDTSGFWNHGKIVGGIRGELVSEWTDTASIYNKFAVNYIGRKKSRRTLTNYGLRTLDDIEYAKWSSLWLYGRYGRRAEFETYFHKRFDPGDTITCDGGLWEIIAPANGSWAEDRMNFNVLEVG